MSERVTAIRVSSPAVLLFLCLFGAAAEAEPFCDARRIGESCDCGSGQKGALDCHMRRDGTEVLKCVCLGEGGDAFDFCNEGDERNCSSGCSGIEICKDGAWEGCYERCAETCPTTEKMASGLQKLGASCLPVSSCELDVDECPECTLEGEVFPFCTTPDSRKCTGEGVCHGGRIQCGIPCDDGCGPGIADFNAKCDRASGSVCQPFPGTQICGGCTAKETCEKFQGIDHEGELKTCAEGVIVCNPGGSPRGCYADCTTPCGNPGWASFGPACGTVPGAVCNPFDISKETCPESALCANGTIANCVYSPVPGGPACSDDGVKYCRGKSWTDCYLACDVDCGIWGGKIEGYTRGALTGRGACEAIDICIAPGQPLCSECYEGAVETCALNRVDAVGYREECSDAYEGRRICVNGQWTTCEMACDIKRPGCATPAELAGQKGVSEFDTPQCSTVGLGTLCAAPETCRDGCDNDGNGAIDELPICSDNPGTLADGGTRYGPGRWPPAGWLPFGAGAPFAKPLGSVRWATNGDQYAARVFTTDGGTGWKWTKWDARYDEGGDYGEPTYYAQPGDPTFFISCGGESFDGCVDRSNPNVNYTDAGVRIPIFVEVEHTPDRHLTVVDQDRGTVWDFWHVNSLTYDGSSNTGTIYVGSAGMNDLYGSGLGRGTTAALFANMAGRIRVEEMRAGRIEHPLFLNTWCTAASGWDGDAGVVYPARRNGTTCISAGQAHQFDVPMGALFALDMTPPQIEALEVPSWQKPVLHAMAEYGMYVGDTGMDRTAARGSNALELEGGLQYRACGFSDDWVRWFNEEATASGGWRDAGFDWWAVPDPRKVQRGTADLSSHADLWVGNLKMVDPCWVRARDNQPLPAYCTP